MRSRYLEVTFRNGKPLAAYLYLPREAGDVSARTIAKDEGVLVDLTADGRAIGIEITSPAAVSLSALNRVLAELKQPAISSEEFHPLAAA